MNYKGYTAKITLDDDQNVFHGEVLGLLDVVTFQGSSVDELRTAFHDSIDDYLDFCEERGEEPEKPYSGRFLVRMTPELHRSCVLAAKLANESLNTWVVARLRRAAARLEPPEVIAPGVVGELHEQRK